MVVYYKSTTISTDMGNLYIEEMLDACGESCEFVYGDINFDGSVNVQDIIIVLNMVLDNEYIIYSDINNDNILNIQDIISIINLILSN